MSEVGTARPPVGEAEGPCPLCGGSSRPWCRGPDRHYGLDGEWEVHECLACGHRFQHPIPSEDDLVSFYPDSYYSFAPPDVDLRPHGLHHRGVWLQSQALKRYLGYDHLPVGGGVVLGALGRLLLGPLDFGIPPFSTGGPKVLDYGTGTGSAVAYLRYVGCDAEGIEINAQAAQMGQRSGLPIAAGSVEALADKSGQYDYISSSHCVEHVPDAQALFGAFYAALRPGGMLAVEVPNGGSYAANRYRDRYYHLALPLHVHHFNPGSLTSLAAQTGFQEIRLATYSRLRWHAESQMLIPAAPGSFNEQGGLRRALAGLRALPSYLRSRAGLQGDCIVMLAQKPGELDRRTEPAPTGRDSRCLP